MTPVIQRICQGKKAIATKWIYKLKPRVDNAHDRKKVRLVATGYRQKKGIDFIETFAPLIKWSII